MGQTVGGINSKPVMIGILKIDTLDNYNTSLFCYPEGDTAAIKKLQREVIKNPGNPSLLTKLAVEYDKIGLAGLAIDACREAISLNPQNDLALTIWGDCAILHAKNKMEENRILNLFLKAIAINRNNDRAYCGIGRIFQGWNNNVEAEKAYKNAIKINRNNFYAHNLLATCYFELAKKHASYDYFLKAKNEAAAAHNIKPDDALCAGLLKEIGTYEFIFRDSIQNKYKILFEK